MMKSLPHSRSRRHRTGVVRTLALTAWLVTALIAGGCSTLGLGGDESDKAEQADKPENDVDSPENRDSGKAEKLYKQAAQKLDQKKYMQAEAEFSEVERQYPYSRWATKAQLMAAFAAYKDLRYDEAILGLERFIELHPGHEDVPYALYLKALSYYEQISDVSRDQRMTRLAMDALDTLIRRFPDSKYARDARLKRDLTLDHLAGKEMEIGRYYLNQGHINAAIGRFTTVIRKYQTTTHVPEALHRLVEAYLTLGLKDQATRVAAVLGHNYPGSEWYERTYELLDPDQRKAIMEDRSWLDKTVDSLLRPE